MPGTFSQIYVQVVFAVKHIKSLIDSSFEEDLYKYITGIVRNKGEKLLAVNGMPDHIHLFLGLKPSCCLSHLVREIKKSSNEFIKNNGFCSYRFNWQEGYGAFSYSHSQLDQVIKYIRNQKQHHKKKTFNEEYIELLKKFNVDYEDKYLFEWI